MWELRIESREGKTFYSEIDNEAEVNKVLEHLYMCLETGLPFRISNGKGGMDTILNSTHIIRGWAHKVR